MFTYSGNPASSARDRVRFLTADTVETDALFQDEEIDAVISQQPTVYHAGVELLNQILARYARRPNRSIDGLSIQWSTAVESLVKTRDDLAARAVEELLSTGAKMYAGGLSHAEKAADAANQDLVAPRFKRDQFTNDENPP